MMTAVMAPAATVLLFMMAAYCSCYTGQARAGQSAEAGSVAVVKILAVFDQSEVELMERVMHKTLIALNKEKTSWASATTSLRTPSFLRRRPALQPPVLMVESVVQSCQWVTNQSAEDLNRFFLQHRPAAILVLSADERSVFRVALAAAAHHLPVIGARPHHGLDDSSFQVSQTFISLKKKNKNRKGGIDKRNVVPRPVVPFASSFYDQLANEKAFIIYFYMHTGRC